MDIVIRIYVRRVVRGIGPGVGCDCGAGLASGGRLARVWTPVWCSSSKPAMLGGYAGGTRRGWTPPGSCGIRLGMARRARAPEASNPWKAAGSFDRRRLTGGQTPLVLPGPAGSIACTATPVHTAAAVAMCVPAVTDMVITDRVVVADS